MVRSGQISLESTSDLARSFGVVEALRWRHWSEVRSQYRAVSRIVIYSPIITDLLRVVATDWAAPLATWSPHGDTRTVMTEPCMALPRKCLFIDLLATDSPAIAPTELTEGYDSHLSERSQWLVAGQSSQHAALGGTL
jgi:hypothetical protein